MKEGLSSDSKEVNGVVFVDEDPVSDNPNIRLEDPLKNKKLKKERVKNRPPKTEII